MLNHIIKGFNQLKDELFSFSFFPSIDLVPMLVNLRLENAALNNHV